MITQEYQNVPTEKLTEHIEVLAMQHFAGRSAIKASCRVRVGRIVINGVKVILPALASHPFVGMPSRKNGDDWEPLINILSPTLQEAVSDAVLTAYRGGK
jgi:DNA-binding cell septation regulator SpoVG